MTLLFTMAQCNGTLDRLAHHAVRICRGNRGVVPIMFFVLAAGLASIGPGNISTAALVAPMAMTTAARANIPLFLMAIMVGNGANAGSLSPFAPTGIIVNGLMARIGMTGLRCETVRLQPAGARAGRLRRLFPVRRLEAVRRARRTRDRCAARVGRRRPAACSSRITGSRWRVIAALIVVGRSSSDVNVGMGAFLAATVLVLSPGGRRSRGHQADAVERDRDGLRRDGADRAAREGRRASICSSRCWRSCRRAEPVTAVVAFITGGISVYSSTSGVVLPAFLPMVPALAAAAWRRRRARDRLVDERRRPSGRCVAALDHRRALHRGGRPATRAGACSTSCWPGDCR